jgi:PKD domain
MILSSSIPPVGSWHSEVEPSPIVADSSLSPSSVTSSYPYIVSPQNYPVAKKLTGPTKPTLGLVDLPAVCSGPTSIWFSGGVSGSLPPDGCAVYEINITEALWSEDRGLSLLASEVDASVAGPSPAFTLYESIGSAPSPSKWLERDLGPNATVSVTLNSVDDEVNEQGGWGMYEWAVVAGSASYGSYCFEMQDLSSHAPACTSFSTRIGIGSGTSALGVNFSAINSNGNGPYTYSWNFGDGSTSTLPDPSHTYVAGSDYVVSLSVKAGGATTTATLPIAVQNATKWSGWADPVLASAVVGDVPTYLLVDSATGPAKVSYLEFTSANYSSTDAGAILNGTAKVDLPLAWMSSEIVAGFTTSITGDAISTNPTGSTIVIAASAGGSTWVFESTNGGVSWQCLTPAPLEGGDPALAIGFVDLLVATSTPSSSPSDVVASTFSLLGFGFAQANLSVSGQGIEDFTALDEPGLASGSLDVVLTTSGGDVEFFHSTDNGYHYAETTIGSFSSSVSSVFNSVGDTQLDDPTATSGQVTAVAEQSNLFVLYTTDLDGRTQVTVVTSGDGGLSWNPSSEYELPTGSIGEPQAVASPVGFVYVTWTDDSDGNAGVDQAVFGSDGALLQNASMLPGTGGASSLPATTPTVALDALMRPLYVWVEGSGNSTAASVDASGAFLSPTAIQNTVGTDFCGLSEWDFEAGTLGAESLQCGSSAPFTKAAGLLGGVLIGSGPCGLSAIQNASAMVYGNLTPFPFAYDRTPTSECANEAPATDPVSGVAGYGPTAPATYLSVLGDWEQESVGSEVYYAGDALASALQSPAETASGTSTLPPPTGVRENQSKLYFGASNAYLATADLTPWVIDPTTAALENIAVTFPGNVGLAPAGDPPICGYAPGDIPQYTYSDYNMSSVGYDLAVTVEGISHTYSQSVTPGGTWSLPTQVFLANLTPDAGISWSAGFSATYHEWKEVDDECNSALDSVSSVGDVSESIPGYSGTLYTTLAMIPGGTGGTFVEATPSLGLGIDSSATGGASDTTGGASATLTTTDASDLVVAFLVVGTLSGNSYPTGAWCSDSADLSWTQRTSITETSEFPGVYEFYADATSTLSNDPITCIPTGGGYSNLAIVVYAVHGADLGAPFDSDSDLPVRSTEDTGSGGDFSDKVATSSSNDMLLGMLGCFSTNSITPNAGFTQIAVESHPPTAFAEYNLSDEAGSRFFNWTDPCYQNGMSLIVDSVVGEYGNLDVEWQNTMNATASVTLQSSEASYDWTSNSWLTNEAPSFTNVPDGAGGDPIDYTVSISVGSQPGVWNASQSPSVSAGEDFSASPLTDSFSCTFPVERDPVSFSGPPNVTADPTANSATVLWYASEDGPSWLDYYELGTGLNWSQTATMSPTGPAGYPYEYVVELQGIAPAALYGLTAWTSYVAVPGCFSYENSESALLLTSGSVPISERDNPYDSITDEGGGAEVGWTVAPGLVTNGILLNGTLDYDNDTTRPVAVAVPIASSESLSETGTTYEYNLSLPQLNTAYTVWLELNYSVTWTPPKGGSTQHWSFELHGGPLDFTYEKDTSGDGLTDLEKILGWEVPVTNLAGITSNETVTANPEDYATNGLVSDYLEKEYDLNPNTVDTAGSHMLDTWNLTFNLAPGDGALPSGSSFEIWYENSSYDPFAKNVSYSPGLMESGNPVAKNISYISASSRNDSGDGTSWAAEALWNYTALETFVGLSGVESADSLRAVEGSWKGVPTLTVEGKLSWGADPQSASTPNDGLPDGNRVSATAVLGLSVQISNLYVSGLTTGEGYAVMFRAYAAPTDSGTPEFTNYSAPVGLGTGAGNGSTYDIARLTGYHVVLPVKQTAQFETIQMQILANTGAKTLKPVAFSGGKEEVNLTYDMVRGWWANESYTSAVVNGTNGSLKIEFKSVTEGGKVPTYLWLPTDGGTTNGLPLGLERYTGEQSFDLVVVNSPTSVSSDPIPLPDGGYAPGLELSPGLNNILVPRTQFLDSPIGEAIFLGESTAYGGTGGALPLVNASDGGKQYITGFNGPTLMADLGAYWQDRSITSGTGNGNITPSTELGEPVNSSLSVRVMAVESSSTPDTGGLASNPDVYSTVGAPPALQSILTLNIASNVTFNLLIAGLIDNTSAGVNGTFQSVSTEVACLGLDAPVVNALANASYTSEGIYGPPPYKPTTTPSGGAWGAFWNAFSSVVTNPVGALLSLATTVWSIAQAASTFFGHLGQEALRLNGVWEAALAGALVRAGNFIVNALNTFIEWVTSLITKALGGPIDAMKAAATTYVNGIETAGGNAVTNFEADGTVSTQNATAFWTALGGSLFVLAIAVGIIVTVLLTLVAALSLGASFLVGILISLVVSFAIPGLPSGLGLSQFDVTGGFGSSVVTAIESAWKHSSSALGTFASSWGAVASIAGLSITGASTVGALLALSWTTADTNGVGIGGAFIFGLLSCFIGLIVYGGGFQSTQSGQTVLVSAGLVGIFGALLGLLDLFSIDNALSKNTAYVALGLGLGGGALAASAADGN